METISMKESLVELDALPILNTFIPEHGFANESNLMMRGLGFSPKDHGIFLKPVALSLKDKARELAGLENASYLKDLLSIDENFHEHESESESVAPFVTSISAESFLKRNLFVPGYMQDPHANNLFIQSIAISEIAKKYTNAVFHVNPKVFKPELLDHKLLAENGYSQIEIHTPGNLPNKISIDNKEGNTLHIFSGY